MGNFLTGMFEKAALGHLVDAGMSESKDLFGDLISHVGDIGNPTVASPATSAKGFGL